MMIHTLSIELVDAPVEFSPLLWVVEIPGEWNIEDLRDLLFQMLALDFERISRFYLANQPRGGSKTWLDDDDYDFWMPGPVRIVTSCEPEEPEDEPEDEADDPGTPPLQTFDQLYPLPKHKKLYFQYYSNGMWRLEIRRKGRSRPAKDGVEYPSLITDGGHLPGQVNDDW